MLSRVYIDIFVYILSATSNPIIRFYQHLNNNNSPNQGCQMAYFQTKNTNMDKFWRVLQSNISVCFMSIGPILRQFGTFCGFYLLFVIFSPFWYVVLREIWQPWYERKCLKAVIVTVVMKIGTSK
jgi:hypothetical protein